MIALGRTGRVFAHVSPADLRNGFDGLAALVAEHLGAEATSGAPPFWSASALWGQSVPNVWRC